MNTEKDIRWEQNNPQDEKAADNILSNIIIGACLIAAFVIVLAAAYYLFIELPYQEAINQPLPSY